MPADVLREPPPPPLSKTLPCITEPPRFSVISITAKYAVFIITAAPSTACPQDPHCSPHRCRYTLVRPPPPPQEAAFPPPGPQPWPAPYSDPRNRPAEDRYPAEPPWSCSRSHSSNPQETSVSHR